MVVLKEGGWILYTIIGLSTATWFLIVRDWLRLQDELRMRTGPGEAGAVGRMLEACLDAHSAGRSVSPGERRRIVRCETHGLGRNLNLIATAGAVLPLLGLLGTVLGMVKAFGGLAPTALGESGATMASGISQALLTTQAGLVTALPIVLVHGMLASRVRRIRDAGSLALKHAEGLSRREIADV